MWRRAPARSEETRKLRRGDLGTALLGEPTIEEIRKRLQIHTVGFIIGE